MVKHTPGPWEVRDLDDCFIEPRVCVIPGNGCYDYDKREANANLIAAAPALLEVLEEAVDWLTESNGQPGMWLAKARAAIAKVKGK